MSTHSQMTGLELHDGYHFAQATDPGAVGANLLWLNTTSSPFLPYRRNSANTAWVIIGSAATFPITTKGDLLGYNTVAARIPVGTNGQALVADSTQALGVKWGTPASATVPPWVSNSPDTPPASPSIYNDEFTSAATLPGGGSAIWTALNASNIILSIVPNGLQMVLGTSTSALSGIYQNVPGSGAWTAFTKVSIAGVQASNTLVGLFLSDGTKLRTWSLIQVPEFAHQTWSNSSTNVALIFGGINAFSPPSTLYLKIQNDLTNFTFSYSVDGYNYTVLSSVGVTTYLTPTEMGLQMYCSNSNVMTAIFSYFRVTQP